jgi:nitrate reductase NapE component
MPYRSQNLSQSPPSHPIQLSQEDQWAIQDAERRKRWQEETRIFLWLLLGLPMLSLLILGSFGLILFLLTSP